MKTGGFCIKLTINSPTVTALNMAPNVRIYPSNPQWDNP